jgi:hypothetical protein
MGRLWGRVQYKGSFARPGYFRVAYAVALMRMG